MTDTDASTTEDAAAAAAAESYRMRAVFDDDDARAALSSATPQQFYVDRAAESPVLRRGEGLALLRMADILYVNKHHDVEQASKFLGSNRPAIPLGLDGPEHRKYRRLLDPVFTAKRIEHLAPQVRQLANEMIDTFIDDGQVDVYQRWCEPLPSTIFLRIMGLPEEDLDDFLRFKNLTLGNADLGDVTLEEMMAHRAEAVTWIQDYFTASLDDRESRGEPGDDMIGMLLTTEVEGDRLTREEILDILGLLMIAGLDTVAAALACNLSYLARHPEDRARLIADPSLWRSAIEELMRWESSVTQGGRIALEDLELPSGETIPAGTHMTISWSAANLDPDYFPDPLTVDLERSPNPHIGFASGFHRCLGSHLARMEMREALQVFHERIPEYDIAPGTELVYSGNPRAPHHFPLVW